MSKLSQLKDKRKETAADKVCAPFIDQIYSDEKQLYFEFLLKVLQKSEKLFVEKGYRLLTLRKVGDQFTIGGDQRSVKRLRNNLALKDMLEKLFMDEEGDDESSEFEFTNTQTVDIPPLFAQPGNKGQGWNSKNIERYLVLLLNLLGAGKGGAVSLGDKTKKPLWFSSKVDWRKFSSPSHASMVENVDLIKGIFDHFNLDIKTHNIYPPMPVAVEEVEVPLEVQAPLDVQAALEVHDEPVEAPLVLGENDLREEFLYEAALENRDDLHASDEEIQQLSQVEVEDGREIPGSQENDLELPDHERDQAPSVDRPGVVQVLVGGRKRIRDSTTFQHERSPKVKRSRERTAKLLL